MAAELVLGLSTVGTGLGLALTRDGDIVDERLKADVRRHGQHLLAAIDRLLADHGGIDALTGLAVCTGPGSFTGIRVGMAAARALAFSASVPLVGVSAFDAYAAAAPDDAPAVVAIDARRGEIYVQLRDGGAVSDARIAAPDELRASLAVLESRHPHILGDALDAHPSLVDGLTGIRPAPADDRRVHARHVALMGALTLREDAHLPRPDDVRPVYVRRTGAELGLVPANR